MPAPIIDPAMPISFPEKPKFPGNIHVKGGKTWKDGEKEPKGWIYKTVLFIWFTIVRWWNTPI